MLTVKPDDEQLHVLPHYKIDDTNEFGSIEDQKLRTLPGGGIEILDKYERQMIVRDNLNKVRKHVHSKSELKAHHGAQNIRPKTSPMNNNQMLPQTPPMAPQSPYCHPVPTAPLNSLVKNLLNKVKI